MPTKHLFVKRTCKCGNQVVWTDAVLGPKQTGREYREAMAEFQAFKGEKTKTGEIVCSVCKAKE